MSCRQLLINQVKFDGDTISIRSVWSPEANDEAEKLILSKTNFLDVQGGLVRNISNEAYATLYALTKE